jgi:aminoglycoside phosphotransferase (APT) family kinase protein
MEQHKTALEDWLALQAGAQAVSIGSMKKLSGGAIQENWAVEAEVSGGKLDGTISLVVRTDAPSGVAVSLGRPQEFALFRAAFQAGVTVPEPLWLDASGTVTGIPLFVMRRVQGQAAGHKLVKDDQAGGGRETLAEALGRELGRIHSLRPGTEGLDFLPPPPENPALAWIADFRAYLDQHPESHPVIEWGLRWLEVHAPEPLAPLVLLHNDFRVGNVMVDAQGVSGVLDWEFASWGDARADLGWFCAPCWRFGARQREAGGIGSRQAFLRGYRAGGGLAFADDDVRYWEVMATVRWAIIALQQADRCVRGGESSLELALTAHLIPDLELDILAFTAPPGSAFPEVPHA